MKKLLFFVAVVFILCAAGTWAMLSRCTVQTQVEGQAAGSSAYVFGRVGEQLDGNIMKLVVGGTAYLLNDGSSEVWVLTKGSLPQKGRLVLVKGTVQKGLKLPGKLGGGGLLNHLAEGERWDFPL